MADSTPSTPLRLPPISHPPISTPGHPPSPLNPAEINGSSPYAIPVGCELIVRGITPENGKTADEVVHEAIGLKIRTRNDLTVVLEDGSELFDVSVIPASSGQQTSYTYCYIRLSLQVASEQTEPRPDLLDPWIPFISSLHPQWSASWSPCKMGRDKRTWCRITRMSGNGNKSNWERDVAVVTDAMWKLGVNIVNAWPTANGKMATVVLAYTKEVEFIVSKSPLSITLPNQEPPISGPLIPSRVAITNPYTQIDPVYAFEVVITGVGDYDRLFVLHLDRFFSTLKEPDGTPFFCSSRVPETDVYCVVLSSWQATKMVLTDTELFDKHIRSIAPNIATPCLLWDVNTTGAFAQRAVAAINKAGEILESKLDQFEAKLNDIHRETTMNFTVMEKRLGVMEDGMKQVAGAVTQMGIALQNTQMAVLAQHQRAQLSDHRSSLERQHERLLRKLTRAKNSKEEDAIEAELDVLSKKLEQADDELTEVDKAITGIVTAPSLPIQAPNMPAPVTPAPTRTTQNLTTPESLLAGKHRQTNQAGPMQKKLNKPRGTLTTTAMDEDDDDEDVVRQAVDALAQDEPMEASTSGGAA